MASVLPIGEAHFSDNLVNISYHAPSDDMNQPLNFDATLQYLQITMLLGYDVAQEHERPSWKQGDFFGKPFGK